MRSLASSGWTSRYLLLRGVIGIATVVFKELTEGLFWWNSCFLLYVGIREGRVEQDTGPRLKVRRWMANTPNESTMMWQEEAFAAESKLTLF
jgi:hypothetical protein